MMDLRTGDLLGPGLAESGGGDLFVEAGEGGVEDFQQALGADAKIKDVVFVAEELALLALQRVGGSGFNAQVGLEAPDFADGIEEADHFKGGGIATDFGAVAVDFDEEAIHAVG